MRRFAIIHIVIIVALVLLVCGIVYALILRDDLDVSAFVFSRGLTQSGKSYAAWKAAKKKKERKRSTILSFSESRI